MFAKLFDDGDKQILVRLEHDDLGRPAVGVHFELGGREFADMATSFEDSEEGWAKAEAMLQTVTIEQLRPAVAEASAAAQEMLESEEN